MKDFMKKWDLTKIEKEFNLIKKNKTFVVLDIETTGFSPENGSEIIQVAAARVTNNKIVDRIDSYVKPQKRIPKKITELTGITQMDVEYAPQLNTILYVLKAFIGDSVVVCHNAAFDWSKFLKPLMDERWMGMNNEYLCTLQTFKKAMPKLGKGSYTNENMAKLFGYELKNAHTASADVEATAHSLIGFKRTFSKIDLDKIKKRKDKAAQEKLNTPIVVEAVNFWEKSFSPRKIIKRQYINLNSKEGKGTVFFDLIENTWVNKDFPGELNFRNVEREILHFLGLRNIKEFKNYRNKAV